ncbi:hypothetical protein WDU94_009769, partial [Cyamophila willieti]
SNALSNDIYLGDNVTLSEATRNSKCKVCVGLRPSPSSPPTTHQSPSTSPTSPGVSNSSGAPIIPAEIPSLLLDTPRAKRDDLVTSTLSIGVTVPSADVTTPSSPTANSVPIVYDGLLDINSNYSGFIEVIGK